MFLREIREVAPRAPESLWMVSSRCRVPFVFPHVCCHRLIAACCKPVLQHRLKLLLLLKPRRCDRVELQSIPLRCREIRRWCA